MQRFNSIASNREFSTFRLAMPNAVGGSNIRVKSLQDPNRKMSKSDWNLKGCIFLTDDIGTIRQKVSKAVTDS